MISTFSVQILELRNFLIIIVRGECNTKTRHSRLRDEQRETNGNHRFRVSK